MRREHRETLKWESCVSTGRAPGRPAAPGKAEAPERPAALRQGRGEPQGRKCSEFRDSVKGGGRMLNYLIRNSFLLIHVIMIFWNIR